MNRRHMRTARSTEAPMDFEWTNRPDVRPAWSSRQQDAGTARKRQIDEVNSPQPSFGTPQTPVFGSGHNQNVPFIFQSPAPPQAAPSYPWVPPPSFSPEKVFHAPEEPKDVDMTESSPAKTECDQSERENGKGRPMALGALRRVYNQRQKSRIDKSSRIQRRSNTEDDGSDTSNDEVAPITQNTSNHYTLNMPTPAPLPSETPYVLLGYLQFFFNLSLVLLFLYLVMQFIITIQRDVEHRISEYSQDIVQEIAMCALQYRNNLCDTNPVPAMMQQCAKWEACMSRDPAVVGRAKVSAELIAEVVNGFVEPISWKTLMFSLSSLSFLTIFVNALLSLYRSRHQPINNVASPNQPYVLAPGAPFPHHFTSYPSPPPLPNGFRVPPDANLETSTRRRRLEGRSAEKIR